ncbi:hypothetical protein ABE10_02360, partial [Bacillus toyonensis]|nr:hypothetical protein [Bacillus toyonensis]
TRMRRRVVVITRAERPSARASESGIRVSFPCAGASSPRHLDSTLPASERSSNLVAEPGETVRGRRRAVPGSAVEGGEALDVAVRAGDDDEVVVGHHGVGLGVAERLAGALHPDDGDVVLRPHAGLVQAHAADELRGVHLGEHEVVVEADEVQHAAA